jgi:hypothetical protein
LPGTGSEVTAKATDEPDVSGATISERPPGSSDGSLGIGALQDSTAPVGGDGDQ